jgi:hypothetical protein
MERHLRSRRLLFRMVTFAFLLASAYLRHALATRNRPSTGQLQSVSGQVDKPKTPANPGSPELTTAPERGSMPIPVDVPPPGEEARCTS